MNFKVKISAMKPLAPQAISETAPRISFAWIILPIPSTLSPLLGQLILRL